MALAPIPAVPDAERRTRKVLTAPSSATIELTFDIWASGADYQNWVEVWQNGVKLPSPSWELTHPSGPLANLPRPISKAVVRPKVLLNGTIDIVGAERPRRPIQFTEGVGVPARDHNRAYNDSTAIDREFFDIVRRTLRGAPGEDINPIPPVITRATKALGFDTAGHPIVSNTSMADLDSLLAWIKYLESLLIGLQKGDANIVVVSSVGALRALTTATVSATAAIVQAYFFDDDTGGGVFRVDMDDNDSADDNGLIIVDLSGRRWKRIISAFATPDMFGAPFGGTAAEINAQNSAMAAACFAQRVPLNLADRPNLLSLPDQPFANPIQLKLDPLEGLTGLRQDIQAWDRIAAACDWIVSCRKTAKANIELHIFTDKGTVAAPKSGAIPVYGQYQHTHTNLAGGDGGTLSVSMPPPRVVGSVDFRLAEGFVSFLERRSEVTQVFMDTGKEGKGYTVPPVVTFTRGAGDTTGGGATAVAYLDPRPGREGKLGGIRITNGGHDWTADPIVNLSDVGAEVEAAPRAGINAFIQQASCRVTNMPADIEIGMPFGIYGVGGAYGGQGDCGAINGAHIVKSFTKDAAPATSGVVRFDLTAPRSDPLSGGQPRNAAVAQDANVCWPVCWLKSTGGWFGAGGGEGLFSGGGVGTVSLTFVAMCWQPNQNTPETGADIVSGKQTPQPSSTDQVGINTSRDGATIYGKDRVIVAGFPGSGVRIARGSGFFNRSYFGGGIQQAAESYIAFQIQGGDFVGLFKCAFGSSNGHVIAIQGGTSGYINHCFVGSGKQGVTVFGWADIQAVKVYSCTTGFNLSSGGQAYGLYHDVADYADKPPDGTPATDPAAIAYDKWIDSLKTTEAVYCDTGLSIGGIGQMNTRIRMTECAVPSNVPINVSAFGGGYFGQFDDPEDLRPPPAVKKKVLPNQTVQVLQIRRESGEEFADAANSITLNKPAGIINWTPAIGAGLNEILTISSVYVNITSIIKVSLEYTGNAGMPILAATKPGPTSFQVKVWNAGTAALNGTLKVRFEIDEFFSQEPNIQDPSNEEIATPPDTNPNDEDDAGTGGEGGEGGP